MPLFITNIALIFLSLIAIVFLYKYRKILLDENSELNISMRTRSSRMFTYLKYSIPVIIAGFILNAINSLLNVVAIILHDIK